MFRWDATLWGRQDGGHVEEGLKEDGGIPAAEGPEEWRVGVEVPLRRPGHHQPLDRLIGADVDVPGRGPTRCQRHTKALIEGEEGPVEWAQEETPVAQRGLVA